MNGRAKDTLRQTTRLAEHASESAGESKGVEKSGQPRFSTAKRTLDAPAARFILPAGALSCAGFQPKLVVLGQIERLLAEFGQVHQARPFGQIEIRRG